MQVAYKRAPNKRNRHTGYGGGGGGGAKEPVFQIAGLDSVTF